MLLVFFKGLVDCQNMKPYSDNLVLAMRQGTTQKVRSFWSDLEKHKDDETPSPSTGSHFSPSMNSVKNNVFVQSDKESPGSPFMGQARFASPNQSPVLPRTNKFSGDQSPSSPTPTTFRKPSSAAPVNRNISLIKSSLSRHGSVGRLHGPRNIGDSSNSRAKKVVTFEPTSPQVIQYEALTPEMSFNTSGENPMINDEYEEDHYDEEEEEEEGGYEGYQHEREDQSNSSELMEDDSYCVPVIEPNQYGIAISTPPIDSITSEDASGPLLQRSSSASRRPLPQLPGHMQMHEPTIPSPMGAGTSWAPLSPDVQTPMLTPGENNHGFDSAYIAGKALVNRQSSLLDSQRKIVTLHHTTVEEPPTQVEINRTVSQKRRSLIEDWQNSADASPDSGMYPSSAEPTPNLVSKGSYTNFQFELPNDHQHMNSQETADPIYQSPQSTNAQHADLAPFQQDQEPYIKTEPIDDLTPTIKQEPMDFEIPVPASNSEQSRTEDTRERNVLRPLQQAESGETNDHTSSPSLSESQSHSARQVSNEDISSQAQVSYTPPAEAVTEPDNVYIKPEPGISEAPQLEDRSITIKQEPQDEPPSLATFPISDSPMNFGHFEESNYDAQSSSPQPTHQEISRADVQVPQIKEEPVEDATSYSHAQVSPIHEPTSPSDCGASVAEEGHNDVESSDTIEQVHSNPPSLSPMPEPIRPLSDYLIDRPVSFLQYHDGMDSPIKLEPNEDDRFGSIPEYDSSAHSAHSQEFANHSQSQRSVSPMRNTSVPFADRESRIGFAEGPFIKPEPFDRSNAHISDQMHRQIRERFSRSSLPKDTSSPLLNSAPVLSPQQFDDAASQGEEEDNVGKKTPEMAQGKFANSSYEPNSPGDELRLNYQPYPGLDTFRGEELYSKQMSPVPGFDYRPSPSHRKPRYSEGRQALRTMPEQDETTSSPDLGSSEHPEGQGDQDQSRHSVLGEFETITASGNGAKLRVRPSLTPDEVSRLAELSETVYGSADQTPVIRESPLLQSPNPDSHIMNQISSVPVPLLTFNFDDIVSENDSMFGDLDKEFDKMLGQDRPSNTDAEVTDVVQTSRSHGYKIRENREVVYATSDNARNSANQRRVSGPIRRLDNEGFKENTAPFQDQAEPLQPAEKPAEAKQKRKTSELLESDRGRLFVRVLSIKKIALPGLKEKKAKFNMILDNGLHSITTPSKALEENVMLEQEFELIVGNNLEFILTLKAKWPKPAAAASTASTARKPSTPLQPIPSTASSRSPEKKQGGFSKLFGSKKKAQNEKLQPSRSPTKPAVARPGPQPQPVPVKDCWEDLTAVDGSFGRVYVAFSQYEKEIFGRAATFDIPCYNEWSKTVQKPTTTAASANTKPVKTRREPYQIGTLQVQMMFVPRASKSEVLPTSIKQALSDLRLATGQDSTSKGKTATTPAPSTETEADSDAKDKEIKIEGFLSQLGGDCKYWRRRYFTLDATTLTAYSETSRKPRVSINLAKAARVIEDRSSLTQPTVLVGAGSDNTGKASKSGSHRRKSAFAETEDAFMFVEEGFRVRFANGEIIDFYADDKQRKQAWVKALAESIAAASVARANRKAAAGGGGGGAQKEEEVEVVKTPPPWVQLVVEQGQAHAQATPIPA